MNKKVIFLVQAAMIAASYIVLLIVFQSISGNVIQIRVSEALTILPYFTPAAIPGLFVGCFLGNFITGAAPIDYVFGSLATLLAAGMSYGFRFNKFLVPIPPIVVNALVIPWVLHYAYIDITDSIPFMMLTVGIGQIVACGVFGMILLFSLDKYKTQIFKM